MGRRESGAQRTFVMAFLTRSEVIRPLSQRFWISSLLVAPEQRQAMVGRVVRGAEVFAFWKSAERGRRRRVMVGSVMAAMENGEIDKRK